MSNEEVVRSARSGRDYPESPLEELASPLDDLLASFPKPIDWDESFSDLGSALFEIKPSVETHSVASSSSTVPPVPAKDDMPSSLTQALSVRRSRSAMKRPTESTTPTRPFKRLRDAFALSPKSPRPSRSPKPPRQLARSPTKIPLPKSPKSLASNPSPLPDELGDIITSFRVSQTHLSRTIDALESVSADHASQKAGAEQSRAALLDMLEERRRINAELSEAHRDGDILRDELRRARHEAGRAAQESSGMIAHLEAALQREKGRSGALQAEIEALGERNSVVESNADRRVFELQQDLDAARTDMAKVKGEKAELRSHLDEAEFAHRALKEGGARLARELQEKERKIDELEKAKTARRWGVV